jgi:hypothetical protein
LCDEKSWNFSAVTTGSIITTKRPHIRPRKTTEFVTNNTVIVPHPPYSPDLAPCDFALFPKLNMKLKGRRFETMSGNQRQSQAVLNIIKKYYCQGDFEEWK